MAAAQTLRMDSMPLKAEQEIPRVDLGKIDNIPYYIESKIGFNLSKKNRCVKFNLIFLFKRGIY